VAAVDGVQLPRSSQRMPGTAWLKAPRTPAWEPGIHRALPLRWEAAPTPRAVPGRTAPRREWEAALAAIAWLRGQLDAAGRAAQRLLVLGDGAYAAADLWAGLPTNTALLARCAKNRALFALPEPPAGKRRGARRKDGDRARPPAAWLAERGGGRGGRAAVRGRVIPLRDRVEGPFLVKRAAARPRRRRLRRDPAFYLVTAVREGDGWALPLPAEELPAWAWQRWEVEVAHRELKAGSGLGAPQCWDPIATEVAAQWQVWAYGVLVRAGVRAWGLDGAHPGPPARWWGGAPRWSLGTLWRGYRQEPWGAADFRPLWAGTGGDRAAKAAWLGGVQNAVAGSLRA
jgi:hypothetical protein